MRAALSLPLLTAVFCAAAHAQALAPETLMPVLAAVASSSATFTESKSSALLKKPLVLQGTLTYRRPATLVKHVLQPYDERMTLDGDTLSVENPARGRRFTTSAAAAPQLAALTEGIRAVRAGDLAALQRHFEVTAAGRPERWSLSLKPLADEVSRYVASIVVSGAAGRLTRVEVEEANGDRSVMDIAEELQ